MFERTTDFYPDLQKVINFLEGIPDLPKKDWCIAGGAIRRIYESPRVTEGDFDIFVFNQEAFNKISKDFVISKKTRLKFNLGSCTCDLVFTGKHTNPVELVDDFDFRCCQGYYHLGYLHVTLATEEDILDKKLNLVNPKRPYSTLRRIGSYAKKGYQITEQFAEDFVDAMQVLDYDQLELEFSYSDPDSFNWNSYTEETSNAQSTLSF